MGDRTITMEEGASSSDEDMGLDEVDQGAGGEAMEEDVEMMYDRSAYHANQAFYLGWPCLSFDVLHDNLGEKRDEFPHTAYIVAGTQADKPKNNRIVVARIKDINKISERDEGAESDESSDEEEPPELDMKWFKTDCGVNRVRSCPHQPNIVATWMDDATVSMWDVAPLINAIDNNHSKVDDAPPIFQFKGHPSEGFAMAWSPTEASKGQLLTGDGSNNIYHWQPTDGASWRVDAVPFVGHTDAVEDLSWSPVEPNVFASCSVDQTIRIWDTRQKKSQITVKAHDSDVNVINWSPVVPHLLLSGADDGSFRIWDLRQFGSGKPAAHFKWHTSPITSVQWHPTEDSMLAVSEAKCATTVWDMSLEADDEAKLDDTTGQPEVPPALMFEHMGQKDVKELHWHKQIPGMLITTASDGFNVFKPCNC